MKTSTIKKKSILVVDDHQLVRKSLCDAINHRPDLFVCGEATSQAQARQMILAAPPDLMVLDLSLTDGHSWLLIDRLQAEKQLPLTLVLSVYDESVYVPRLLKAGVRGYLMKDTPITGIMAAIDRIFAGHIALSDRQASLLIQQATDGNRKLASPEAELESLSDRELQVLEALGKGLNNQQIADLLGISPKTVSTYKTRLMKKTGIHTSQELMRHAQRELGLPSS
ncbi:MAG: response regulator transcription factor [Verrucomicrobiota bacterium]